MFYTLADIPKSHRSKIDHLQLVMVFREKLLKTYSYRTIYKYLVDDLKLLENGMEIQLPYKRVVKCGIICHPADNLEVIVFWFFIKSYISTSI